MSHEVITGGNPVRENCLVVDANTPKITHASIVPNGGVVASCEGFVFDDRRPARSWQDRIGRTKADIKIAGRLKGPQIPEERPSRDNENLR